MCNPQDPFFRSHFSSEDLPFQPLFQLQTPCFILEKYCISRPIFANFDLIFSSWATNLAKICSGDPCPVSSRKISSGDCIFKNLGSTYLPNFLSTTSPGEASCCLEHMVNQYRVVTLIVRVLLAVVCENVPHVLPVTLIKNRGAWNSIDIKHWVSN